MHSKLIYFYASENLRTMKNIVLLYWPKGGNVENSAKKIFAQFNPNDIEMCDVESFDVDTLEDYKTIIMGSSTVGAENWIDAANDNLWNRFFRKIEEHDLSGHNIAVFGLGDQVLYPAHFVDVLGILNQEVVKVKGTLIGKWPTKNYSFTDSEGVEGDYFYGLALYEDNESDLTGQRVAQWVEQIKSEIK